MDPVAFACGLIDIDSTTGREGEAGRWLARELRDLGFAVTEQPVDAPALKLTTPVPLPPVAVAVPVVPYVTLTGPVTVSKAWVARVAVAEVCCCVATV